MQVDEKTISATKSDIEELIVKAFNYWKDEFAPFNSYKFVVSLGTQTISLQNCNGLEDLRFQFGVGTLSNEQRNYFKNYKIPFDQIIAQTT